MTESGPSTPETIASYRLGRSLGRGTTGQVFEAIDRRNDRPVALKLLWPHIVSGSEFRTRFQQEMRVAATLSSPHIAKVLDSGYSGGWYYIAMEHVDGESLATRLQRGALEPRDAAGIALDVARAIEHAAAHGVAHGDLKPENILLMQSGEARLTDFGMGRIVAGRAAETAPVGQPDTDRDRHSDQYALGAILYEMLAGGAAPVGPEAGATAAESLSPPALAALAHAPPALAAIVARCMADDPSSRYAATSEIVALLAPEAHVLARKAAAEDLTETLAEAAGVPLPAIEKLAEAVSALREETSSPLSPPPSSSPRPGDRAPMRTPAAVRAAPPPSRGRLGSVPTPPPQAVATAAGMAMRSGPAAGALAVGAAIAAALVILLVTVSAFSSMYLLGQQLALDGETASVAEITRRNNNTDAALGLQIFAALLTWPALAVFGYAFTAPVRQRLGRTPLTRTAGAWSWLIPLVNTVYPFFVLDRAARERGLSGGFRGLIWLWCLASVGGTGVWVTILGLDPEAIEAVSVARDDVRVMVLLQAIVGGLSIFAALCPLILAFTPKRSPEAKAA